VRTYIWCRCCGTKYLMLMMILQIRWLN